MVMRGSRTALLAACAFAVLGAGGASAQDAAGDGATVLAPIVLKGSRVKAQVKNTAADTPLAETVTREEIDRKQVDSFTDLGRSVDPSVSYNKATGGVNIRGMSGARVTTLIDGVPIPFLSNSVRNSVGSPTTNADGGADSFDFNLISGLDVVKGADSSRAGGGALGGAVLVRTLAAEDLIAEGEDWGGMVKTTYDSEDRSFGGAVAVARQFAMTSVLVEAGYKRGHERRTNGTIDTIGTTRTEANPADYDQRSLLAKLKQDFEGGHSLTLTAEHYEKDFTADLKRDQGATYRPGDYWGDELNARNRVSLGYGYESESTDGLIDAANLTLYYQELERRAGTHGTRLGSVGGPWLRDNQLQHSAVGLTGYATKTIETDTMTHEVIFGGDLARTRTTAFIDGLDACILGTASPAAQAFSCPALHADQSDMPDVDGGKGGVFLEDKISFGETGLSLTPGLRFDWYDYSPKLTPDYQANSGFATFGLPAGQDGTHVSPKLRAAYQPSEGVEFYAQWASAFRAPTIDELYVNFTNTAQGYANIGNPTLRPETGDGFEAGVNFDADDYAGRISVFHNRYKDFIDTVTTTVGGLQQTQYVNVNRVNVTGFELKAEKQFDSGFNLHGALAYAHGENVETGALVRSVAPVKGIFGVGYLAETWGTDLSLTAAAAMPDDGVANTFEADGYGVVDLTAWIEPEQFKGLRIQGGIYNLFDKTYYDALANRARTPAATTAFYSEPGRGFQVSVIQKF